MFIMIGSGVVVSCVVGGYLGGGGHLDVLWQPFEFLIILGAAVGSFITGNTKGVVSSIGGAFKVMMRGPRLNKASYIELLSMLYTVFRLAKTKGDLALESHVEKPSESPLFQRFPNFVHDHHALEFLCDYLRLLTLGTNNAHEVEAIIDAEIESHHNELHARSGAITNMGDAMPALGIVAAVLGVIHTMGSITEPPEVLGHLIGGALVGTFFGVLCAYGFVGPFGSSLAQTYDTESMYLQCIKTGLLAHMQGYAPQVSIEFARKILPHGVKPSFSELEDAVSNLSNE
ncbi:MAG: flagellar motor stator protein MotA [Alphaproteobacteria bacterium]